MWVCCLKSSLALRTTCRINSVILAARSVFNVSEYPFWKSYIVLSLTGGGRQDNDNGKHSVQHILIRGRRSKNSINI